MTTFIAFLRAVNVGGNPLKMERLRNLCRESGFANIRTYAQSGNVVFESKSSAHACRTPLENLLKGETRLPVAIFLYDAAELRRITEENPFVPQAKGDHSKLYVTFLAKPPTVAATAKLAAVTSVDRYVLAGSHVFLCCTGGYGRSKFSNPAMERALGVTATTRNWNTLLQLLALAQLSPGQKPA